MDETKNVVLCVCVTMSQEDMILSHVYLYVYVDYILYVPAILSPIQSVICVYVYLYYVLCYVAVNPHKYTRIEGETWKYGYFNPW